MSIPSDLLARREAVMPRGVPRASSLVIASAHGSTLVTTDGREVLDFVSGIGVMATGHSCRPVIEAIQAQVEHLQHVCIHIATYEPYVVLCERLAARFPHGRKGAAGAGATATKVMLINSGAEAVENAVKIARQYTGRSAVICYSEAFHGRTLMGMSLTSKAATKLGCGPYAPEVYRLPYPNRFRYGDGLDEAEFTRRELRRFAQTLVSVVPAEQVAAVIVEVVQGEGGFNVIPFDYLRGLRKLCDEHGIVLIFDEVQSGFCRTGRWAAYEHAGVIPDLSTWAKALGGGLPISAVIGRAEVMDGAKLGTIGSTYGGNPVACAAALATLDFMEREDFCGRARALGERMVARLSELAAACPLIAEVRGLGAMRAIELVHDRDPNRPASTHVQRIVASCLERGLLILTAGTDKNSIRLLPPLIASDEEIDRGLEILCEAVLAVAGTEPVESR